MSFFFNSYFLRSQKFFLLFHIAGFSNNTSLHFICMYETDILGLGEGKQDLPGKGEGCGGEGGGPGGEDQGQGGEVWWVPVWWGEEGCSRCSFLRYDDGDEREWDE